MELISRYGAPRAAVGPRLARAVVGLHRKAPASRAGVPRSVAVVAHGDVDAALLFDERDRGMDRGKPHCVTAVPEVRPGHDGKRAPAAVGHLEEGRPSRVSRARALPAAADHRCAKVVDVVQLGVDLELDGERALVGAAEAHECNGATREQRLCFTTGGGRNDRDVQYGLGEFAERIVVGAAKADALLCFPARVGAAVLDVDRSPLPGRSSAAGDVLSKPDLVGDIVVILVVAAVRCVHHDLWGE